MRVRFCDPHEAMRLYHRLSVLAVSGVDLTCEEQELLYALHEHLFGQRDAILCEMHRLFCAEVA